MIGATTLGYAFCNNAAFLSGLVAATVTAETLMLFSKIFDVHPGTSLHYQAKGFALGMGLCSTALCHSVITITRFSAIEVLQIGCVAVVIGFMIQKGFKYLGLNVPAYVGSALFLPGAVMGFGPLGVFPCSVTFGIVGVVIGLGYGRARVI